ncbi:MULTISPECIES: hypothetical protein [unclassified Streptomyces]|uniref:hypothetical protein n=1 Tax=unclassified Streptomyces TaxID=2593676 RepID=UPI00093E312A|nr:hypothetical protein [Streptomyces sp. CB01883]OKJ86092.1 hypothetical protein AMK32_01885 [Streptomyces sp. CB01883]
MPTYYEVMHTELSKLSEAADKWDAMADSFEKLANRYRRDVHKISVGEGWAGLSAHAASARFDVTLKEFQGAKREAKAVASLLREAHTEFEALKKKVEAARDDAVKAGMRVSGQGVVTFDLDRLEPGARTAYAHDPDYQRSVHTATQEWARHVHDAVNALNEADEGLRLALASTVKDSDSTDGTLYGFNRHAGQSHYPTLSAIAKAAHIPKERSRVGAWWRELDPVTRGILLQEKGDDLINAGIMDPQYKWHSPDAGSGRFDSEKPTPHDLQILALAQSIGLGGDVIGENAASRNMEHYLKGTGEPLDLDVNRILHDDSQYRTETVTKNITPNQQRWRKEALEEFEKAGGTRQVAIPVESHHQGASFAGGEWFHAIGSHEQNVSGVVIVTPTDGGKPKVTLNYQVNMWDRYNWDAGKSTTFPGGIVVEDNDMGRLHKVGFAREFDMRGSSSMYTYDLDDRGTATIEPPDPGRAGTRTDVSRGDEVNR